MFPYCNRLHGLSQEKDLESTYKAINELISPESQTLVYPANAMCFYVDNNRKQYSLKSGITKINTQWTSGQQVWSTCIGLHRKFWWRGNIEKKRIIPFWWQSPPIETLTSKFPRRKVKTFSTCSLRAAVICFRWEVSPDSYVYRSSESRRKISSTSSTCVS